MSRALLLIGAGLAVGLPVSLLASRKVAALPFNVPPEDSAGFVTTARALLIVGAGAPVGPALRASRIEPMRVLREE